MHQLCCFCNSTDWLIVHLGWTESRMSMTRVQLLFFLPPLIISLGLATPATFLGMYNPFRSERCGLTTSPYMCDETHAVECNRGDGAWIYWLVYSTFLIMCNVLVVVFASLLIYQVINQERKGDKFLMRGQETRRTNSFATGWQGILRPTPVRQCSRWFQHTAILSFVGASRNPPTSCFSWTW